VEVIDLTIDCGSALSEASIDPKEVRALREHGRKPSLILSSPKCNISTKRTYDDTFEDDEDQGDSQDTQRSFTSTLSARHSISRREAYYQMLDNANGGSWSSIALLSTDGGHSAQEKEL
jgi:hypothetical protein